VGVGNGVDGYFGGVDDGVLNNGAAVICSRKVSICFSDRALWSVSRGRIGGTPPKPSIAVALTVLGIMSLKLGALLLPEMTAVENRELPLPAASFLKPRGPPQPNPSIL
jgi:hypothetical protein